MSNSLVPAGDEPLVIDFLEGPALSAHISFISFIAFDRDFFNEDLYGGQVFHAASLAAATDLRNAHDLSGCNLIPILLRKSQLVQWLRKSIWGHISTIDSAEILGVFQQGSSLQNSYRCTVPYTGCCNVV